MKNPWLDRRVQHALAKHKAEDVLLLACPNCHEWSFWAGPGHYFRCHWCAGLLSPVQLPPSIEITTLAVFTAAHFP